MKKILNYIMAVLIALPTLSGCSKFDTINTNPDATETVNAGMLATNIILMNIKFNGRDAMAYLDGNGLAKYIAFANQSIMPSQYNQVGATGFGAMTILPNIESMLNYAKGSIMEDSYKGLAKFSRAYMFYNLTMQVGDIPYSQAGGGKTGSITPKYDTQEEVFRGILNDLQEADAFFAAGKKFDGDPTPYNGDPEKWRRATNAFALRVLMSLSKKANSESLNIKSRFADIVNSGYILQENTGFLGLNYSSVNMHPMSGTNDLFTSRTIVSSLVVDNLKQMNDRRLFYFADPAGAQITSGKNAADFDAYVGADVSDNYDDITAAHSSNTYSLLNSRYLKEPTSEPRRMMTYAEQQLILAEAVIRGWINGDAKAYYESGVRAALSDVMATNGTYAHGMQITQSYIDNYFTGQAAFSDDVDTQLKQVWMQKYLMNFMMDSFTAYTEYRRTSYPEFPVNPETSLNVTDKNAIPMRWLYPSSEYNYNRENLIEALNRQYDGVDDINKIMWVLK